MKKNIFNILFFFLMLCDSNYLYSQDPWKLSADKPDSNNYYGETVANGIIGIISSPEPLKVKEVVLAGTYDVYKRGRVSSFIPNYNLLNMRLAFNGESVQTYNINNYKQELDMSNGAFTGSFQFKDFASVTYSYYALRHLPHCVMMVVNINTQKDVDINVENLLETPSSLNNQQNYFQNITNAHVNIPLLTSVAYTPIGRSKIAVSNTFLFEEGKNEQPEILHRMNDADMHAMSFDKKLKAGKTYSFALIGSLISSDHINDPYNEAERLTIYAALEGKSRLLNRHSQEWDILWQSDIQIEGDPQAQQDIRSMLYHLYSFTRKSTSLSPSPMGLSGLGYNGHVFWDTEIWMFPPLLLLHPEIAKSMIEYRFQRLDAARKKAALYGYDGAMYPWESADSGSEETPVNALTGVFEHHITGDVAIAAWQYYLVTGDKEWLKEKGWPILKATAEFWASRVEKNDKDEYEIKNVVAADEWAENVDNNAYTNGTAIRNLQYASKCAAVLGVKAPKDWNLIAAKIPISKMSNGVTREHDSYSDQNIKQADVNLLAYPLQIITDRNQIKKDLKFYETKIPHSDTPAMTQAIFSLLYSRLGDSDQAYHWFKDAYQPNLNPPFRVIAECKGGTNPYFATGAGGVLQAVMMGFGGLDIDAGGGIKQVKSVLPKNWKKLTITGLGTEKKTFVLTH
ncbi:glycosyl hydrolase family 95 catalytic domain-containing protein [Flavobacterium bizetiae]|uniref:glycosyl hydrolase family 95 catalytic domain-containing protein n=1 Tax=Flavobacterium bizetiae TaxID=2704140 RepID=UPI0037576BE8